MTSSFRYPPRLLHSLTEPQWLPPADDQQTSSLDRLEEEEQAHVQLLKRQVLPENIPDPIGMDDSKKFALNAQQSAAAAADTEQGALFLLLGPPSAPPGNGNASAQLSFWQKYQSQHSSHAGIEVEPEESEFPEEVAETTTEDDEVPIGTRWRQYITGESSNTKREDHASHQSRMMPPPPKTSMSLRNSSSTPTSRFTSANLTSAFSTTTASAGAAANSNTSSMMSFSHDETTVDHDDDGFEVEDDDDDDDDMDED